MYSNAGMYDRDQQHVSIQIEAQLGPMVIAGPSVGP
jgi:hypothetical protein